MRVLTNVQSGRGRHLGGQRSAIQELLATIRGYIGHGTATRPYAGTHPPGRSKHGLRAGPTGLMQPGRKRRGASSRSIKGTRVSRTHRLPPPHTLITHPRGGEWVIRVSLGVSRHATHNGRASRRSRPRTSTVHRDTVLGQFI